MSNGTSLMTKVAATAIYVQTCKQDAISGYTILEVQRLKSAFITRKGIIQILVLPSG